MLRIIQGSQIRYFCTRSVQLNKSTKIQPPPINISPRSHLIQQELQKENDLIEQGKQQGQVQQQQQSQQPEEDTSVTEELTEEQLAAIQNLTSTLYQPVNPFSEPSKASEIEAKIQSIQERLLKQQKIEEERYAELVAQQHELLKPTLSDFKRPLTSFFLLGSAVYLLIQYTWSYLEGEEHLIELDDKCKLYEVKIQELLDEQKAKVVDSTGTIVNEFADGSSKNKRKWFWWF